MAPGQISSSGILRSLEARSRAGGASHIPGNLFTHVAVRPYVNLFTQVWSDLVKVDARHVNDGSTKTAEIVKDVNVGRSTERLKNL